MLTYEFEDYQIIGKLTFNDRGYQWYEYQLEGLNKTIWLNAEMDDELELSIYEKIKTKVSKPIPNKLTVEGITYYLDEKGKARVTGEGRSQNVNGHDVMYFDYCDEEEEAYLSVEEWGTDIEVSRGYAVQDYDFNIIAGS